MGIVKRDIAGLPKRTAATLRQMAQALDTFQMPKMAVAPITVSELGGPERGLAALERIWPRPARRKRGDPPHPKITYLYRIRTENLEQLRKIHEEAKAVDANGSFKFAQVNEWDAKASALYVGQSTSSIIQRMGWHFGVTAPSSYGMHLHRWLSPESKQISLFIDYWCFPDLDRFWLKVMQELENQLWDDCMPILGKRGGK